MVPAVHLPGPPDLGAAGRPGGASTGASAIILTVDITGLRHPSPEANYAVDPTEWPLSPGADRLVNLDADLRERARGEGGWFARDFGFRAIEWLRERTGLPVVVKGVLRGDDARRAVDAGASAVLVSTHGARAFATLRPERPCARRGGGCGRRRRRGLRGLRAPQRDRRGHGPRPRRPAVFLGRPVMWGLATGGEAGVRRVLETVHQELVTAMDLLGAPTLADLTRDLVVPA